MLSSGRVDNNRLFPAGALHLPDAESMSLQPPSDCGRAELHVQPVTFDLAHRFDLAT